MIYLYPSEAAARDGEKAGGTGFFVGVRSEIDPDQFHIYAVTNSHVIREAESPVVRLNTTDGNIDILPFNAADWVHHSDGDDVAICKWEVPDNHRISFVKTEDFITKEKLSTFNIGMGDETFMVGRFINHEGKQKNQPTLRFGNIAMMPWEPIKHGRGHLQESFVVESRSLSGFSGSPVFVHLLPYTVRPDENRMRAGYLGPWLLGIDWGHNHTVEKVREKNGDVVQEGWEVRSNSGMMNVVPAWKLYELLNEDEFIKKRQLEDKNITKRKSESKVTTAAGSKEEPLSKQD